MKYSPFPGMDPYLEEPKLWQDVHNSLMFVLREKLTPVLLPNYTAELETEIIIDQILPEDKEKYPRSYRPDVSIIQPEPKVGGSVAVAEPIINSPIAFEVSMPIETDVRMVSLKIRHRESRKIVTAIELLSPINKRQGKNRDKYLQKRLDYVEAKIKLVELDLLRKYERMPFEQELPEMAYFVVSAKRLRQFDAWAIQLHHRLPIIPIYLQEPDPPVSIDIQDALDTAYERARYDLRIDYTKLPEPPLTEEEITWIQPTWSFK
ncbi:MAG: DUF4058 family protein [Leptospiraceae bacterium]|nr:DUF4058 family protein [Leptospiraceae bacterium]